MRRIALVLIVALSVACGRVHDARDRGPALVTLHGTLEGANAAIAAQPIHLAVLWYPQPYTLLPNQPPAILSNEVVYQGQFPIDYRFDLFEPPPDAALFEVHLDGKVYREATGVVIAYQDDGDGVLRTIGTNGTATDRVLGASLPQIADWGVGTSLLYQDDEVVFGEVGYQLIQDGSLTDFSVPVPITLTAAPDLELFLCEQLFSSPQVIPAPGTVCATPLDHPVFTVSGQLTRFDDTESLYFSLSDGIHQLSDAEVTVNDRPLTWDATFSSFDNQPVDPASPQITQAGTNRFSIDAGTVGSWSGTVEIPETPSLVSPTADQLFGPDQAITIRWTGQADSFEVNVWDVSTSPYGVLAYQTSTAGSSVTTPALSISKQAAVRVDADGTVASTPHGWVSGTSSAIVEIFFDH